MSGSLFATTYNMNDGLRALSKILCSAGYVILWVWFRLLLYACVSYFWNQSQSECSWKLVKVTNLVKGLHELHELHILHIDRKIWVCGCRPVTQPGGQAGRTWASGDCDWKSGMKSWAWPAPSRKSGPGPSWRASDSEQLLAMVGRKRIRTSWGQLKVNLSCNHLFYIIHAIYV